MVLTPGSTYFHIALVVAQLEPAMERLSRALGYEFNAPIAVPFPLLEEAGSSSKSELRVSYSRTGPPHLELMEATADGLFSLREGQGFHHIGIWSADPEATLATHVAAGQRIEAVIRAKDGLLRAFFVAPDDLFGLRLEYVNELRRPGLEAFFAGGPFPADPRTH